MDGVKKCYDFCGQEAPRTTNEGVRPRQCCSSRCDRHGGHPRTRVVSLVVRRLLRFTRSHGRDEEPKRCHVRSLGCSFPSEAVWGYVLTLLCPLVAVSGHGRCDRIFTGSCSRARLSRCRDIMPCALHRMTYYLNLQYARRQGYDFLFLQLQGKGCAHYKCGAGHSHGLSTRAGCVPPFDD